MSVMKRVKSQMLNAATMKWKPAAQISDQACTRR